MLGIKLPGGSYLLLFGIRLLIAVSATIDTVLFIYTAEHMRKLLLGRGDATGVGASDLVRGYAGTNGIGLILFRKKLEDQSHTDVSAVLRLLEIASAGVLVDFDGDLVDTRQRVHDAKIRLCVCKLIQGQDITVF